MKKDIAVPVPSATTIASTSKCNVVSADSDSANATLNENEHEKRGPATAEAETDRGADGEDEGEDESKYAGGFALGILMFGLWMATFVIAFDNMIIGAIKVSASMRYTVLIFE